jgi:hypothetical protein
MGAHCLRTGGQGGEQSRFSEAGSSDSDSGAQTLRTEGLKFQAGDHDVGNRGVALYSAALAQAD